MTAALLLGLWPRPIAWLIAILFTFVVAALGVGVAGLTVRIVGSVSLTTLLATVALVVLDILNVSDSSQREQVK